MDTLQKAAGVKVAAATLDPLFRSEAEYEEFCRRHNSTDIMRENVTMSPRAMVVRRLPI